MKLITNPGEVNCAQCGCEIHSGVDCAYEEERGVICLNCDTRNQQRRDRKGGDAMNTDQRLERIESLLECMLEVAKIQAISQATSMHYNDLVPLLESVKPIEHPNPAPRSAMDEVLSGIVRENREDHIT